LKANSSNRKKFGPLLSWLPVLGSVTLMAMISVVSGVIFSQVKDSNYWREHSYEILATAETFRSHFFNVLRNAREYVLTGQPAVLKSSQGNASGARRQLIQLELLTRDNPGQQLRLSRISTDLDQMFTDAQLLIDARNAHGIQAAAQLESSGKSIATIDQTVIDWQLFIDEEQRLLSQRSANAAGDFHNAEFLLIYGSLLAALLVILANLVTSRAMAKIRRAHEQLREQAAILERAQVLVRDMEGRIVQWNLGAERLYGFSKTEVLGRLSDELFRTEFPESLPQIEDSLNDTGRWEGELVRHNRRGERLNVASQWVLHRDPAGNPVRILEVDTDVTERMQAQKDLELRNIDLQQFAFMASHDLKTPLRTISGFVELLQANYSGRLDDRGTDWIRRVSEGAHRLETCIDNLLLYSRLDSQATPFEPVNCQTVLRDALESLQAVIHETEADITAGELPTVMADGTQLLQLFQNLIDNGIKYRGAARPSIHVSSKRGNGEWVFSFADNGIGIGPEHHQRVFELFRRLHTLQAYPGDGIGLTLCRRIVGRHKGRIWVESEIGKGCTFFFTIIFQTELSPNGTREG
jgi:PAS domain S-box-containing protein